MKYSFSVDSWHVKLFKLLWGFNPVYTYNTMCPYFWRLVLGIVLFPILLLRLAILAVAEFTESLSNKLSRASRNRKYAKYIVELDKIEEWNEDIIDKIAKRLKWNSDFIDRYLYERFDGQIKVSKNKVINYWDIRTKFENAKYDREEKCNKEAAIRRQKWQETYDNIIYHPVISKIIAVIAALIGLYALYWVYRFFYWLLHLFTFSQFVAAFKVILVLVIVCAIIVGIIGLISFIIDSIRDWKYKANKTNTCRTICKAIWDAIINSFVFIFNAIINGFKIVIDMIVAIYKRSCPRITWKND